MTQALLTLGFGVRGSIGQVLLVGLGPITSTSDPIAWIEFTAFGAIPRAVATGVVPSCVASLAAPLASCVASEAAASGSGAVPIMSGSGRPLR